MLDFRQPPLKLSRGGFHLIWEPLHPLLGKPEPHRFWDTKNGVCYYCFLLLLLLLLLLFDIVIVISFSHLLGNFKWGLKIDMHKTHPIKC